MDITSLSALTVGSLIKNRKISTKEVVQSVLREIEKTDKQIGAYITVNVDGALKRAEQIDQKVANGQNLGVLMGVPIAIKDNICTKGLKTTCASKMLENFVPSFNATAIERLENAGAIILGKLNMDEYAMGNTTETSYYGAVKNPFNKSKTAGGSSGGGAAAVAANMAFCALGSDTGGSVRLPASYCSVVGFKPTYSTVSRYGLIAHASSLDQIGTITRDVADAAAIYDIIGGFDPLDSTTSKHKTSPCLDLLNSNVKGLRVAVVTKAIEKTAVSEDVVLRIKAAAETLKSMGAMVEEISCDFLEYALPTYTVLSCAEASSNLARYDGVRFGFRAEDYSDLKELYSKTRAQGFGKEVKKRMFIGTLMLSEGYYDEYFKKALAAKEFIIKRVENLFEKYDVILSPTVPNTAPDLYKQGEKSTCFDTDVFTVTANLTGCPAISVPFGFDQNKMPIGVQVMGNRFCDQTVLNVGFALEESLK